MKKVIYIWMMCVGLLMTACDKDEIGGTATQALAGEWYVTVDIVDANHNVIYENYSDGHFLLNTYNTAANVPNIMYVDDNYDFWGFKTRVNCDVETLTFSTNGAAASEDYDLECNPTITDGKVMYGAATTPHGTPADSIVFYVTFANDTYGDTFKIAGYRYSGLVEDDD